MTWLAMILAALVVGTAKTSFGGLGSVAVALLALSMPTKESTATALLLLICGDIVAVSRYRRSADWGLLKGLLPSVVPGIVLGALFIRVVDDLALRRVIGWLLIVCVLIQLVVTSRRHAAQRRRERAGGAEPAHQSVNRLASIVAGVAAGFTTMTANAAGPVMAVYLQLVRVDKMRFLGTSAWFYLIVNLSKTPFTAALGLFTPRVLTTAAVLIPVVLVGTWLGTVVIRHVAQRTFDIATLLTSVLAAGALVIL